MNESPFNLTSPSMHEIYERSLMARPPFLLTFGFRGA